MISYIKGILAEKNPTSIVIETGGIGYQIEIPLSSFDAMGETGDEIVILTYLHVREDKMTLYGFATEKERKIFRLLIGISGVGPKLAQGILSGISANDLVEAI
ncbi:Holliday junction branch migration protein RuvA, partial [candidate division KSB1 bacterium]